MSGTQNNSTSINGSPGNPANVTLSSINGSGLSLTYANVTLTGSAGITSPVDYAIGVGGKLIFGSTGSIAAGSTVTFGASDAALVLGSGITAPVILNGIAGFGPGNTIDVSALAATLVYSDSPSSGTGGTLSLVNSSGTVVGTLGLTTGEYVSGDFRLSADGSGGTLVNLGIVVSGISALPSTADLKAGNTVVLTVTTSAPVSVASGTPTLVLNDGGVAVYDPTASRGSTLSFNYTVAAGQNTPDLTVLTAALNGASVTGAGGVPVDLTGVRGNPAGILQIDTTAPTVAGVSTNPGSGTLGVGQSVVIDVGLSEPVSIVGGVPTLTLSDGGTATYDPAASTASMLVFNHTVQAGQSSADLAVTNFNRNSASITDGAGNVADLTGALINPAGILVIAGGGSVGTGSSPGTSTPASSLGVYRFFDSSTGTHFFTADPVEKNALMLPAGSSFRPDMREEVNGFGAVDPAAADPNAVTVYRFFDTRYGTHFFTANATEANGLRNVGASSYRPDLVFESGSSFLEHGTQQAGDVPVYRLFDQTYGTHFYTGNQAEYAGITTPGSSTFRSDLVSEGVGFYAPSGSFS